MTPKDWHAAKELADERMKAQNGHTFAHMLKTRCMFCGRSPKAHGKCGQWFQSFLWQLDRIVLSGDKSC